MRPHARCPIECDRVPAVVAAELQKCGLSHRLAAVSTDNVELARSLDAYLDEQGG
jgi:hypothetical protein